MAAFFFLSKYERHTAIRELLLPQGSANGARPAVISQEDLRQKLARRGFDVTQATLSRDIRELHLMKGPNGYALPGGEDEEDEDAPPSLLETLASFALRVRQAQNQLVVITTLGGAQPVAAAIDREALPDVVGTLAGDDTVLVICPDTRRAARLREQLVVWIG